jgi:drug/metabolite transporter (DMT)-like permease
MMSPFRRLLLIIMLTAMWSPSFLFIKLAVTEIPPMTVAASRVTLAALILAGILLYKRRSLPTTPSFWIHSSIMAFFSSVCPFYLFCYGEQTIESALAAIINGSTPMFTAIMAHFFLPSDKMTLQKGIGVTVSITGLLLLFAPNIEAGLNGTAYGMTAVVVAAICYAISHVYGKKYQTGYAPFVAPTSQLIASAVMLAPLTLIVDKPWLLPTPSLMAVTGICCLALLGTVIAFYLYYKLLESSGPTALSMVACFFPVGGMFLGFIFLGETLTLGGLIASALIFLGLSIVTDVINLKPLLARRRPVKETG